MIALRIARPSVDELNCTLFITNELEHGKEGVASHTLPNECMYLAVYKSTFTLKPRAVTHLTI